METDKRKLYNQSWENLKLGPIGASEKAKINGIYKNCLNCNKEFRVSHSTSKKKFCSKECKAIGQSSGLTAPMRYGTGRTAIQKIIANKYNRYVSKDGNIGISRTDFIKLIESGECYYCGSTVTETLGFDRIDNTKGHIIGNVLICCELCNTTKGHRYSVEQMKQLGNLIKTFNWDGWRTMGELQLTKMKKTNETLYELQRTDKTDIG